MWFGVMDGAMYLISGNGETADWYLNMRAHPLVTVKLGGIERVGRAGPVTDFDERHRCGDLGAARHRALGLRSDLAAPRPSAARAHLDQIVRQCGLQQLQLELGVHQALVLAGGGE